MEEYIFIKDLSNVPVYGKNGYTRDINFKVNDAILAVVDTTDNTRIKYLITEEGNTNHISIPTLYVQKKQKTETAGKVTELSFFDRMKQKYQSLTGPQKVGVIGLGIVTVVLSIIGVSEIVNYNKKRHGKS